MFRLLLLVSGCLAGNLATKPQMGWNTYNAYKLLINETVVKRSADSIISTGLAAAGYTYVLIDGGWSGDRTAEGLQQANASRFPSGMVPMADYIHDLGLKMGIYSDAGIMECAFHPGSYGNEELDAATFASWGVDYLKYDNCGAFQAATMSVQERHLRMASAILATGRDIFLSLCEWGNQFPWLWADQFSDSYRIAGDIHASFAGDSSGVCTTAYCLNTGYAGTSVLTLIRKMREISVFQKPGSWADMDLLEVGNNAMTALEEQTHFSFWAALKSPLIVSADLTSINETSLAILLNEEIIAINQDDAGVAVSYVPYLSTEGSVQIWAGLLSSGSSRFVILALNENNSTTQDITIPLASVPGFFGLTAAGHLKVRDVWDQTCLTNVTGDVNQTIYLPAVQSHQTKVLVFSEQI